MIEKFYDQKNGGFFMNEQTAQALLRPKELSDHHTPSGNTIALIVLHKLIFLGIDKQYSPIYAKSLASFANLIE